MCDFFISYTTSDKPWAEWIAWQLEANGYRTILQAWDFKPGSNYVHEMQKASSRAKRTIAVLSKRYLNQAFPISEWTSAFAKDADGRKRKLIPVRIEECRIEGIMAPIVYVDLVNVKDEEEATSFLLSAVDEGRSKPLNTPSFPLRTVRFPGTSEESSDNHSSDYGTRFIHARINAGGVLNLGNLNPYCSLADPTDYQESVDISQVYCYAWFPRTEYLGSKNIQRLTPVSAICTVDSGNTFDAITRKAKGIDDLMQIAPSKLRNEYRERFLVALRDALASCFAAAITFPDIILRVGGSKADYAYQALVDLFLHPLIEMHRKIDAEGFHIKVSDVGKKNAALIRMSKSALKREFYGRSRYSIEIVTDDKVGSVLTYMARLLAWSVGSYYNHNNSKWISILEE